MSAIFGAIALLILFLLFALVIWRLCNGEAACAAQSAHVPSDYKITPRADEIVCTSEGCFRTDTGEYVPLDREAA